MIILIVINKNYLNLFKKLKREFIYPVKQGIYLAFDMDTLEYLGVEMFYLAPNNVSKVCDDKLKLFSRVSLISSKYLNFHI